MWLYYRGVGLLPTHQRRDVKEQSPTTPTDTAAKYLEKSISKTWSNVTNSLNDAPSGGSKRGPGGATAPHSNVCLPLAPQMKLLRSLVWQVLLLFIYYVTEAALFFEIY